MGFSIMGKKSKNNEVSEISDSGTLSLDVEQHQQANERKAWKRSSGSSDIPLGEYPVDITLLSRGTSKGKATSGSPNFRVEGTIASGDHAGTKLNAFYVAAGETANQYYQFLEGVMGISVEDFPVKNGKVQIPIPSQAELDKHLGDSITMSVDAKRPRPGGTDGQVTVDCSVVLGGSTGGSAKKAKKSKIAS